MTIFNPATHEALFATSATANERLWCNDMQALVLSHLGLLNVVQNATPATPPADPRAIWLTSVAGGASEGTVKIWNGVAPVSTAANWIALTPANLLLYTSRNANAAGLEDLASRLMADAPAKATIAAGLAGGGGLFAWGSFLTSAAPTLYASSNIASVTSQMHLVTAIPEFFNVAFTTPAVDNQYAVVAQFGGASIAATGPIVTYYDIGGTLALSTSPKGGNPTASSFWLRISTPTVGLDIGHQISFAVYR